MGLRQSILSTAADCSGKKMWSGFGLNKGTFGCAAALSNVLNKAGLKCKGSAVVVVLRKQVLTHPGTKEILIKNSIDSGVDKNILLLKSEPGDLIFGYMQPVSQPNLGGNAHCGVVADKGTVMGNDWADGIWKQIDVDQYFSSYKYLYLIKTQ
ncbi:MAG: hypothetical protein QG625_2218 [Cyanobacteriota bacterium erpe_2018_sw_39hr_WHONDRS-SW48-000098_B_bin.30]|jgi:hypothetical protein|nr:hypothetical protein [Cyanobacteriota bacterium erpe_2018_sw_39hr_WHONDRS-SW48-000098_B_bin.30]